MADSTVPVTVVPHAVIQETMFFRAEQNYAFDIRKLPQGFCQLNIVGLITQFPPSLQSYLTDLTWSAVEKLLFHVTTLTNSTLARCELSFFSYADTIGFSRPRSHFLTGIVLKVPAMGGRVSYFLIKGEARRFHGEVSPFWRRQIPYPSSIIAGISIPIGSHAQWLHNFSVDI